MPTYAGGAILILFLLLALLGHVVAPHGADDQNLIDALANPSRAHTFGTDPLGRDVLSRVILGTRLTMSAALIATGAALVVGVFLGVVAGYPDNRASAGVGALIDLMLTIPSLVLAVALASILGAGLFGLVVALSLTFVPPMARLVRGRVLEIGAEDYVQAARALGGAPRRIMFRHVLPNAVSVILVEASLSAGQAVLVAAALGFLGLGVQPPAPEWGTMLGAGREYMDSAPHLVLGPGLAISLLILGFNLFGDGLRDRFDRERAS